MAAGMWKKSTVKRVNPNQCKDTNKREVLPMVHGTHTPSSFCKSQVPVMLNIAVLFFILHKMFKDQKFQQNQW